MSKIFYKAFLLGFPIKMWSKQINIRAPTNDILSERLNKEVSHVFSTLVTFNMLVMLLGLVFTRKLV